MQDFGRGVKNSKDERSERQKAVRTPGIETVRELISTHRRTLEEELAISGEQFAKC
jgi:hypothetical protein